MTQDATPGPAQQEDFYKPRINMLLHRHSACAAYDGCDTCRLRASPSSAHYHGTLMRTDDLDYHLPPDRIATEAVEPRDAARMMVVRRPRSASSATAVAALEHHHVRDLPTLGVLQRGDLIVVNRTRVLPAYLQATRSATGGRVTGLFLDSPQPDLWTVMLESRGRLTPGERIDLDDQSSLTLIESLGRGQWRARLDSPLPTQALLEKIGHTPLPPYIRKARRQHGQAELTSSDEQRYNTVFAREAGSIAAPTAGLHFTSSLLAALETMGVRRAEVTLDVGLGTFEPIRSDDLEAHPIHRERLRVPAETIAALKETRRQGRRIIPIGTTTVRALESLPESLPDQGDYLAETGLFIYPGADFAFRFTDSLMTNFHLPRSTLLAMIAALPQTGLDEVKRWYRVAIEQQYRFYSYGDAMLIV